VIRRLAALILLTVLASAAPAQTRKIEFTVRDSDQLVELEASGAYEIVEVHGDRVVALETPGQHVHGPVDLAGVQVLMPDIDQELAEFRRRGDTGKYHTVASSEAELKGLAEKYPAICKLESLGKTYEGRDMWCLRITGAPDTKVVPRMLIFGLVHAREWISMELPHHLIRKLLEGYGTDAAIKTLVDTHAFWIMPITNPDGLAYSQSKYRMWRKNRSKRGSQIGVDVNRNFEIGWGTGSSASPGSDVYRGPNANSEEETRALLALVERERFHVSLSFHSYSELILYPWGHSRTDPPGKDVLAKHGKAMSATNKYRPGSVAQILYTAGGATDDTFFAKLGCWSWTFELAREFVPPDREIPVVCEQNWPAVLHLMKSTDELAATPPPPAPAQVPEERFADLYRALVP
jgi:carboxypeptidase T